MIMVYIIRNRHRHYKKYRLDIWGLVRTTVKLNSYPHKYRFPPSFARKSWMAGFKSTKNLKLKWSRRRFPLILTRGTKKRAKLVVYFYKLWEKRWLRRRQSARRYVYRIDLLPQFFPRRRIISPFLRVHLLRTYYMIYHFRQLKHIFWNAHKKSGFYENNLAMLLECRSICFLYRTGFLPSMFSAIEYVKQMVVLVDKTPIFSIHRKIKPGELVSFQPFAKYIIASSFLKRVKKKRLLFAHAPYIFVSYALFAAYLKRLPTIRELVFPVRFDLYSVINYFASRR